MKLKNRETSKPKLKEYIGKKPVVKEDEKVETKNEFSPTKRK